MSVNRDIYYKIKEDKRKKITLYVICNIHYKDKRLNDKCLKQKVMCVYMCAYIYVYVCVCTHTHTNVHINKFLLK